MKVIGAIVAAEVRLLGSRTTRRLGVNLVALAVTLLLGVFPTRAEDRLWLDASINGKPVRLALDTGAGTGLVLFPKAARRLGLSFTNYPKDIALEPGNVGIGRTEPCTVKIGDEVSKASLGIVEIPSMINTLVDGVLGWLGFKDNILMVDASMGTVFSLASVPDDATNWVRLNLLTNSTILEMEPVGSAAEKSLILVDTGSERGVELPPDRWRAWKSAHSKQPTTLEAIYMPSKGLIVAEEGWAKEIDLGPLRITEVPVCDGQKMEMITQRKHLVLGMAALRRVDFIIDGKQDVAYLRPRKTPPASYEHNRLGAVFTPVNIDKDNDLVAQVVEGSPAHRAGIRKDDVLLKIDELDVTRWRTDPAVLPLSRFWNRPPGTKMELTVRRGKDTIKHTVELRNLLAPEVVDH